MTSDDQKPSPKPDSSKLVPDAKFKPRIWEWIIGAIFGLLAGGAVFWAIAYVLVFVWITSGGHGDWLSEEKIALISGLGALVVALIVTGGVVSVMWTVRLLLFRR